MEHLRGLTKKTLTCPESAEKLAAILQTDFDPGTDRVDHFISLEDELDPVSQGGEFIFEEANSRSGSIGAPNVHPSISIPIDQGEGAGIIGEIKSTQARNGREATAIKIEKGAIPLPPAERSSFPKTVGHFRPMAAVIGLGAYDFFEIVSINRCVRQDLSPPETSQIIRIFSGHEAIGHKEILKRIVVQIYGQGRPTPPPHRNSTGFRSIRKGAPTQVLEQGISAGKTEKSLPDLRILVGMKPILPGNTVPRSGIHVADVEIVSAIMIKISRGQTHPEATITHSRSA